MAFHRPSGTAFQGKGKKLRTMVDYLGQQWSHVSAATFEVELVRTALAV
jgi:hypothetical protein